MRKIASGLVAGVVALSFGVALPLAANADAVTFSFTGTVDSTTGSFSTAGSSISGTYTFDYAAADPLVSSGSLSDVSSGVTFANLVLAGPLPSSVAFTESFSTGGVSFSSPLTTATGVLDLVSVQPGSYVASDTWVLADGSGLAGSIVLSGTNVFNPAGLPLLTAGTTSLGQFNDTSGNSLSYHLNTLTLTQAPEIDPASSAAGVTLLLAVVAVLQERRKRKPNGWSAASI